jgi:hypothetical protein
MSDRPPDDDDFLPWRAEQEHQAMLDEAVHCPSCGFPMPMLLTDSNKPLHAGRFHWWCGNTTCNKRWESHYGELRPRIPEDKEI